MTMMSAREPANDTRFVAPFVELVAELDAEEMARARDRNRVELADFVWEARQRAEWLNEFESLDPEVGMLDRFAVLSALDGRFHIGTALVDRDDRIHDLYQHSSFANFRDAEEAYFDLIR